MGPYLRVVIIFAYNIFVGKPEVKGTRGKYTRGWKETILKLMFKKYSV
jgi:hypothetical protein